MQLSREDWGVLLRSGCGRQKPEFEHPRGVPWGWSVCELLRLHQWHKLRDLPGWLLQAKRGKCLLPPPCVTRLGAQTIPSIGAIAYIAEKSLACHFVKVNSQIWQCSSCFSLLEVYKVNAQRNRKVNCVDTKECTWGQGLQLVFQFNLKEDVVL